MKKLVKYIVDQITQENSQVDILDKGGQSLIQVKIPQEKIGQVIGRQGRVIKAIRQLVNMKAAKDSLNSYYKIEITDLG
ncbi:MAG: KH domain-containing protein [Candidatus Shapirobacteria bacterium]